MVALWMTLAMAGYGDPVAGVPQPEGRQLHLWANAARVDPEAFEADYLAGGCSFYSDFSASQTTPKVALRHDADLMAAADAHSLDMFTVGFMDHTSSDGTDFATRVWSYYPGGAIAENIAWNGGSVREVVLEGWMCSSGHRANIMSSTYDDFGGSRHGSYATQNFGQQGGSMPYVRGAAHELEGGTASLYSVLGASYAPDAVEVVVDGGVVPMSLRWGTASSGVYGADVGNDGACHEYYVRAWFGTSEVRYPETGSYGWGACAWDDAAAQWVGRQLAATPPPSLSTDPWVAGASVDLTAIDVLPGSTVHYVLGTQEGQGPCPGALGGACVGVTGYVLYLGNAVADGRGEAVLRTVVPAAAAGRTVLLQAMGDAGSGWVGSAPIVQDVP